MMGQRSAAFTQVPLEQRYGLLEGQRMPGAHVAAYSTHSPEGQR